MVLGLDLGTNSIGWSLLEEVGKKPVSIIATGSRIFEQSVEGSIEDGNDEPLAVKRRDARQVRRQLDRRSMRRIKTMRCLQLHGLLPEGDIVTGKQRQTLINDLDVRLRDSMMKNGNEEKELNQLPYFLRAIALDIELPPHAFGRAILHLCQRRGYKSNRKDGSKGDDTKGTVLPAINELSANMCEHGARTLGEYYHKVEPHKQRIRKRWTGREMYEHEFKLIWAAQQQHNPKLYTQELRDELYDCIFSQRSLKSQKSLIAKCELEPNKRRASFGTLAAQRFRYIQRINDLRIKYPDDRMEDLTQEQRAILYDAMESNSDLNQYGLLTFAKMRTLLGAKKKDFTFNLEEGGEKNIPGNKTAYKIRGAIDEKWDALDSQRQKDLVGELMGGASDERLKERFKIKWGFTEAEAEALSNVSLEDKFCSLSTRALNKLLPHMEQGIPFATAKLEEYGDTHNATQYAFNYLPPLEGYADPETGEIPPAFSLYKNGKEIKRLKTFKILSIRNPVVHRVLSQVRQLVNAIIKEYGKPDMIRIELARDIKKPRDVRQKVSKNNRDLQKERDKAKAFLSSECNIPNPKRRDIEKYMLWKECEETCPYTGNHISRQALFGNAPQYDIEHIIPFSRCLDNSFMNKTLCYHEENRNVKGNKTPFEAYAGNDENYQAMLARVKGFKNQGKLKRFTAETLEDFEGFTERQLNDTRYASKEARKYLSLLYGSEALKRIQVSTGTLTAGLRNAWKLNSILNDGGAKTREDHRHHAVDAIVIALITPKMVKSISNASKRSRKEIGSESKWFKKFEEPWEGFYQDCRDSIDSITASHMYNRKVRGGLHEETNYSKPRIDPETGKEYVVIRKNLDDLIKEKDIQNIVDPAVREAVMEHFIEYGKNAKKAYAKNKNGGFENPPMLNHIPIYKVRMRKNSSVTTIGKGDNERQVILGNNHHVEVIEYADKKGNPKWDFVVVDMFTCMQRVKEGISVVQRDHGEGKKFIMSLCKGDSIIMENTEGVETLYIVRKFDRKGQMYFKEPNDARLAKNIPEKGSSRTSGSFLKSKPRKVSITPLGKIYPMDESLREDTRD